jgi:hypothetical protein
MLRAYIAANKLDELFDCNKTLLHGKLSSFNAPGTKLKEVL